MTRELPGALPNQELLSAFLDDELTPAERAQVEKHLAASEADRLLVSELRSLRSEVASLPPVEVKADFTDRVVRAALEAAKNHDDAGTTVVIPTADVAANRPLRSRFRIWFGAAVTSAAALAASFLLVVQPWREDGNEVSPRIVAGKVEGAPEPDAWLKPLREAVLSKDEAIVFRLRADAPIGQALISSLERVGIAGWESNAPTGAKELLAAHQRAVQARQELASDPSTATLAVADAIFIEAPLPQMEAALKELATNLKQPLTIATDSKHSFTRPERSESEPGGGQLPKAPPPGKPFTQRLDANNLLLHKDLTAPTNSTPSPTNTPQTIRVLLLIEAE